MFFVSIYFYHTPIYTQAYNTSIHLKWSLTPIISLTQNLSHHLPLTPTLTISQHTLSHSLSHTSIHILLLSNLLAFSFYSLSITLSLFHSRKIECLSLTHKHSLVHLYTLTLIITPTHSHTSTHTYTYTQTRTHTQKHILTQTHL